MPKKIPKDLFEEMLLEIAKSMKVSVTLRRHFARIIEDFIFKYGDVGEVLTWIIADYTFSTLHGADECVKNYGTRFLLKKYEFL
ncbi:MAG: hypothetical protein QW692_02010 [Nitrososphaerota archaeon]